MEELIKLVRARTGIDERDAKIAIETVNEYLRNILPAAFVPQVEFALTGQEPLPKGGTSFGAVFE